MGGDLDSFQPITDVDERSLVGDVIEHEDAVGASKIRLGDAAKPARQVRTNTGENHYR